MRSIREGYKSQIAKCWQVGVRERRRKRESRAEIAPNAAGRGRAWGLAKMAGAKSQLTEKWTVVPAVIIIVVGTALIGRDAIYTWIDWNYRTENPHAAMVPNTADLMVTIDLSRLRDPDTLDALNGWRQRATAAEGSDDVTGALSAWTGRDFTDDAIRQWTGRRLTVIAGPWGAAIAMDARETERALEWLERSKESEWTGWLDSNVVWLAQDGAATKIAETKRYGLRTALATTADYRRAREAHTMKGAQAEIFVRWRQIPEPWKERLTSAMDCSPEGWIATRVRADGERVATESICRTPAREWRPRTIGEIGKTHWEIPASSAVWIVTAHSTGWGRLKTRLTSESGGASELAESVQRILEGEGEQRGLLAMTAGAAMIGWDSRAMRFHAQATMEKSREEETKAALDAITAEIAGQWGATAGRRTGEGVYELRHGLWGGGPITVRAHEGEVTVNRPTGLTNAARVPAEAVTVMGWTDQGAQLIAKWTGGTSGAWIAGLGSGEMIRKQLPGLTVHRGELAWPD